MPTAPPNSTSGVHTTTTARTGSPATRVCQRTVWPPGASRSANSSSRGVPAMGVPRFRTATTRPPTNSSWCRTSRVRSTSSPGSTITRVRRTGVTRSRASDTLGGSARRTRRPRPSVSGTAPTTSTRSWHRSWPMRKDRLPNRFRKAGRYSARHRRKPTLPPPVVPPTPASRKPRPSSSVATTP